MQESHPFPFCLTMSLGSPRAENAEFFAGICPHNRKPLKTSCPKSLLDPAIGRASETLRYITVLEELESFNMEFKLPTPNVTAHNCPQLLLLFPWDWSSELLLIVVSGFFRPSYMSGSAIKKRRVWALRLSSPRRITIAVKS